MADPTVIAAVVLSVPATVSGLAAWRSASKTHNEVKTNHGLRQGDYVELTAMVVGELKEWSVQHAADDRHTFEVLSTGQDEIRAEQARVAAAITDKLEP